MYRCGVLLDGGGMGTPKYEVHLYWGYVCAGSMLRVPVYHVIIGMGEGVPLWVCAATESAEHAVSVIVGILEMRLC